MPPSRIEVPLHQTMRVAGEENVPQDGTANHYSHQRNDTQETACHKHERGGIKIVNKCKDYIRKKDTKKNNQTEVAS